MDPAKKGPAPPSPPLLGSHEFERLLKRLAQDIISAAAFNKLRVGLKESYKEYSREINESNTFWFLSMQAYREVVLYRLGRVYVHQRDALSLLAWLKAIRSQPHLIPTATDPVQLGRDIELGNRDPLVKKLICLRGNFIAHINWDQIASGGIKIKKESFALTWDEIDLLISRAGDILNRYSALFNQTRWSMNIVGRDDYKRILKAVRSKFDRVDAEIAADIDRANRLK